MGAVRFRIRAEARKRVVAWIALGLVAGIGSGALLAAVAGARRTTDAYDRLAESHKALDFVVTAEGECPPEQCDIGLVEGLSSVSESVRIAVSIPIGWRRSGSEEREPPSDFMVAGSTDGRLGSDIDRWLVVDGRVPNPDASDEAMVGEPLAARLALHVGDEIEVALGGFVGEEPIATIEVTVVGIMLSPSEFDPATGESLSLLHVTPALIEQQPALFFEVLGVRLHGGPDQRAAFGQEISELGFQFDSTVDSVRTRAAAREMFRDDAASLTVFAIVGAILSVVLVGQALHRQQVLDSAEDERLKAIGFARSDLRRLNLLRTTFIAIVSTVTAALMAIALSPLSPIGEARAVEPDPGVAVDWALIGIGALAAFVVLMLLGVGSGERVLRHASTERPTRSRVSRGYRLLPTLPMRLGAGLAFEGRRRGVPLASVFTGIALATGSVIGASTFNESLEHLQVTPSLYGKPWDDVLYIENPEAYLISDEERELVAAGYELEENEESSPELNELMEKTVPRRAAQSLANDPSIAAVSLGFTRTITVGSLDQVESLALEPISGTLEPTIIEGRQARTPDEIVLGGRLLEALELDVGDTVEVDVAPDDEFNGVTERRIVGRGVSVVLGEYDLLGRSVSEAAYDGDHALVFVKYASGVDVDAFHERLRVEYGAFWWSGGQGGSNSVVLDVEGMETTPQLIVALTAFFAVATLLHFGLAAARRHAGQIAVLRALGTRRRDVARVLGWHSGLVVLAAIVVGAPLGYIAGRAAWLASADGLYVRSVAIAPSISAALIVALGLGVAFIAGAIPAWASNRGSPATALRSE